MVDDTLKELLEGESTVDLIEFCKTDSTNEVELEFALDLALRRADLTFDQSECLYNLAPVNSSLESLAEKKMQFLSRHRDNSFIRRNTIRQMGEGNGKGK
jgi:hypothetical protein